MQIINTKILRQIVKQYAKEAIFKGKEQSFKISKNFVELKDREVKIKREIES